MKTKKLIALTMLTLFALLIVPMASNTAAQNTWTPLLPNQVNTPPKATTTEPLGNYINPGDNLTYTGVILYADVMPMDGGVGGDEIVLTFEFNYGSWGDWFLVNTTSEGEFLFYFAIHNQTREVGLNSTGGLFYTQPINESFIYPQDNVYAFIALPTGIVANDNVKTLSPFLMEEIIFPAAVNSKILGRTTSPVFMNEPWSFYDTWMSHGSWKGTIPYEAVNLQCAMGLNNWVENGSGLCVRSFIVESLAYGTVGEAAFYTAYLIFQFNSTLSTPGIIEPLEDVNITDYYTTESILSGESTTFKYNETGYWYMNLGDVPDVPLGKVRMDSLSNSYVNWTLGPSPDGFIPLEFGISQEVRIPTDLWELFNETWNSTYYNEITHTGWRDIYVNGTEEGFGISDL